MASEDSFSSSSDDGPARAFWAVELVPGKEFKTNLDFDLHITQAVLPASAKDAGRSVVNLAFGDEPEKSFALAALKLDHNESQTLDIALDQDSEIKLTVSGKNNVHLSGYYVPNEQGPEGMYDSDEEGMDFDEEISGSESDEEGLDNEIEIQQQIMAKRKALENGGNQQKKAKTEPAAQKPKAETPKQPAAQKPKADTPKADTPKAETPKQQPQQKQQQQQKSPAQQKDYPNGLQVTIERPGTGPEAVKGKTVSMKYVGRLTKNNKIFDASKSPFRFRLGTGEVIQGWDQGIAGMRVGEKRKLVIPAKLGYGAAGAPPDIPPNSSLTFDVELLKVQ